MRRSRRGGHSGLEFGGSGEDSFVAVVVTKLTGALLFILLLTMVIMALIPRADLEHGGQQAAGSPGRPAVPLAITTPGTLPDAVAGRPYIGRPGRHRRSSAAAMARRGDLPDGLSLEESSGRIAGTPPRSTDQPMAFRVSADDGTEVASAIPPARRPAVDLDVRRRHLVEAPLAGRRRRLADPGSSRESAS